MERVQEGVTSGLGLSLGIGRVRARARFRVRTLNNSRARVRAWCNPRIDNCELAQGEDTSAVHILCRYE